MPKYVRASRILTPCLFALAAGGVGCADDVGVTVLRGELSTEANLDFGDVQRGIKLSLPLVVKNIGTGALTVERVELGENFTSADYEYKLSESSFSLGANLERELSVSFQPFADQAEPVRSFIRFVYDCDAEGTCKTFTVNVSGRGVTSGLTVEPEPVDFGTVLIGSSRTLDVTITNNLSVDVAVRTPVDAQGRALITNMGGLGRFELVSPLGAGGSLLTDRETLAAGTSVTVQVRYVPDPGQEGVQDRGRWVLSNCDNPLCDRKIDLLGRGTNAAIECDPVSLEFGDVNPGASTTLATRCTNAATETVTVTGWRLEAGTPSEYEVEAYAGTPAALPPGESFQVEVTFSPTLANVGRPLRGALEITGRNPRANRDLSPTRIPVNGTAGGPDIQVSPMQINFGQVAIGTVAKRRILVENVGYSDLTVSMVSGDVASVGTYSVDRNAFAVPPGGAQIIELSYRPLTEATHASRVLISSDDADEGEVFIEVSGDGIDLPPCSYNLAPASINFGIVEVLRSTTQGFRIENTGTDDCLVNDLALGPESDMSFGLVNGNETGVIIPAGMSKTVLVEYNPGGEGVHMGSVPFYISDPANSSPVVQLRGVGAGSALLITPNEIDFGQVGVGCATRNRQVTIYNTGSQNAIIERIELPSGVSAEFVLGGLPAPNTAIAPGQSIDFTVRYRAADLGQDIGFLHVFERGRMDPYVVPLYGEGAEDPVNEDRFTQLETPEVDILFVIDNSCSMSDEQASLGANFTSFINFADAQGLDYQIAVVSTDVSGCPGNASPQRPTALDQGQCGYFADGDGDASQVNADWRMITPTEQPSPEAAFGAIVTQGINGAGVEEGLEAAYRALSSPLITGWNGGFLRQDAYLALIFVSDEEDQSPQTVDFYSNYFQNIKGFRNTQLFSASAIVNPSSGACGGGGSNIGARYIEVANRTGGITESICTQDWSTSLQNLGLSVFGYKSKFFLSNQPVAGTVEVLVSSEVGGTPVVVAPRDMGSGQVRWTYDVASNSVNFGPLAIPEPGSEIIIRYIPECL